jgi:RNA polymerase-interacting CarD/CdnL/TRCF family regulator
MVAVVVSLMRKDNQRPRRLEAAGQALQAALARLAAEPAAAERGDTAVEAALVVLLLLLGLGRVVHLDAGG